MIVKMLLLLMMMMVVSRLSHEAAGACHARQLPSDRLVHSVMKVVVAETKRRKETALKDSLFVITVTCLED